MKKIDIEKSLKRFLKRKISYSLSLLIAFMITGGISLGAGITAEEIQETKGDLLTKIQTEREEIKRKIAENERLIKEYNSDFVELVRKGDFYSKPLMPSTQVFFSYQHLDNGKMKDVTDKEFAKTIDAVNKYYGTSNGSSLLKSKDKVIAGNGTVIDNEVFRENVEVGANIKPIAPVLPTINPNVSVNVSVPVVNLGALPGTVSPTIPTIAPITAPVVPIPSTPNGVNVSVATPGAVDKITVTVPTMIAPTAPTINISPVTVNISLNVKTPGSITSPTPKEPDRVLNIVDPDASPFSDFSWAWMSGNNPVANTNSSGSGEYSLGDNINVTGGIFWSGVKTDGTIANTAGYTGATQEPYNGQTASNFDGSRTYDKRHLSIINSYNGRWTGRTGNRITGGTFYVAGDVNGISYSPYATGTEAFHLVADVHLENVTANLYGKAAFINAEAFRGGQTTMKNVTINVLRDENTVFHLKGSRPGQEDTSFEGSQFATKFAGNANITIDTKKNSVYAVRNFAGGLKIENTGKIVFNGASNIGVSFLTWVPDKSKYIGKPGAGTLGEGSVEAYIPYVKLASNTPMEMYGDENVGIFFNKKISGYDVGIHQGYFDLYFNIGTKLSSSEGVIQTTGGQLGKDGYTAATVDGNVGVYAISGQRNGVDVTQLASQSYFTNDPIHNLIMDNFDIKFGKYSKNGFMFLAKNGTVIDIQGIKTTSFSDGINGTNTAEADTGMGTIIAFAEGKWTAAGTSLVGNGLEGKPTEIIVDKNLNMMSKEGIAFFAKDGGLITVKKGAEGYGYSSIIGYADNGTVNINADIKATDGGVATENKKYNNIGGYAIANGTITVTGNAEINGLGAFANGANAKVYLKGAGNVIKTGVSGGLASLKGGYVEFGGGTIEHKDIKAGDHDQKLPFFADDISKINFIGATTITMYNGAVFSGDTNDYAGTVGTSAKYNGMGNVTISLQANGINLGVFKNQNIIWNGEAGYLGHLATIPKVASIQENGHWYNSYLEGGTMAINKNVDLDAKSDGNTKGGDAFNDIGMEREQITINSGIKITSISGNGLVLGSNITANTNGKNNDSGYINNGEIKISGGNQAGVYVSYGHIQNNSLIETDGGSGTVGVNGSKIENTNTGKINIGTDVTANGVGIVGLATKIKADGTPDTPESYGTDGGDTTTKVLEISNKGAITVNGISGIGIYAENNVASAGKERAFVENIGRITVGDSETSAVAIGMYGKKTTISNTGTISVGAGGVAIYAENGSNITNLGTLKLGSDAIGIMTDGTSTITATNVTLESNSGTDTDGKTAVYYKGSTSGTDNKSISLNIDAENFDKGTAVYAENMNLASSGALKVGTSGVGIFVKGTAANTGKNTGSIELGTKEGAVGMYTKTSTISNESNIKVGHSSQIGMYAEGTDGKVLNTGNINLSTDNTKGIYVKSGATTEISGEKITFAGKSSIGVFAEDGAKVKLTENLNFANDNANKNIYIYGKNGSSVTLNTGKSVAVNGITSNLSGEKTVGIYLENNGTANNFSGSDGTLNVLNEAVAIYSKGNNILNVNISAEGKNTTGIFIDGPSTLTGIVTAKGTASTAGTPGTGAIGVYGNGGAVTIGAGGLTLNMNSGKGTGMYLTDGAFATGEKIIVNNTAANENNIGLYYSKGNTSGIVNNEVDIKLQGSSSIGIYAADSINLGNEKNIESAGMENIASFVGGSSTLTSGGNITMSGTDNIGIYTGSGVGKNTGIIDITGAAGTSAGMVANTAADIASIENSGDIKAGTNLGMYIAGTGTSSGKNTGNITVTGNGTGVYVDGANNSFNGTGGTITSEKVGIYLKNTTDGKITTGNLTIAQGGVGIFGENSVVDFSVDTSSSTEAIGVVAKGTSLISGNIITGEGSVGVYAVDNSVVFNGANIITGANTTGAVPKTSVGVLLKAAGTYTMDNVSVNAKNGVGIYLEDSTQAKTLTYSGSVTTENGIGIYVTGGNTITTETAAININGGTGVYINGGTANLGTTSNTLAINFLENGGIGIYNKGGVLNLGSNITVTGAGSLAATLNGSLNSAGNITVGDGGAGLYGTYDSDTTTTQEVASFGTITAQNGGIGLAATKGATTPTGTVTVKNTGTINVAGKSNATNSPSVAIYTDIANIENTGNINVGDNGIGIYSKYNGVTTSIKNDNMTITGNDAIGIYINGATNGITANNITSIEAGNTGVLLEGVTSISNINVGTVALGNASVGVMATANTISTIEGTISVGKSSDSKSAIGIAANAGSNITLAGTASITTGEKGIGVYAEGAGTIIDVQDASIINVGNNGIYLYSKDAALSFSGNITANNQIGIVAEGGTVITAGPASITAQNGGIGAYIKNAVPTLTSAAITVKDGSSSNHSIGIYYQNAPSVGTIPVITQIGNKTIGVVLDNSAGNTSASGINLASANEQVGVMAKNSSTLTVAGSINISGGNNNVGVYGTDNSTVTLNGNMIVAAPAIIDSTNPMKYSSVGVFLKNSGYTGNGDISIGNYSIGIYGKELNGKSISHTGTTMAVGNHGVGIYGTGTGAEKITLAMASGITLGKDNSIGVFADGMNSTVTGNIAIGTNTSIGIASKGTGNVDYTGDMTIADKVDTGSVGIYKLDGAGTIATSAGNWNVGNSGYGIYVKQTTGKEAEIYNSANMALGMSAVGIYSEGKNKVLNTGNIEVGETDIKGDHNKISDHLNSVGIYAAGGSEVENAVGATIKVHHDHSVGVYVDGANTSFKNYGTIDVDYAGVGVIVRNGAIAVNEVGANIILGNNTVAGCNAVTVGMSASGTGSKIVNNGTITINAGVGMNINEFATVVNTGTLNVNNGVGIEGTGTVINTGTMNVAPGAVGENAGERPTASVGAVVIKPDGTIYINDQYTAIGGTFETAGDIVVNGAHVDITTGTPMFNASSVSGEVKILSNFASTGNGISYKIENFVNTAIGTITGNKLTPVTSPLFVAKVTNSGDLVIAKRPYADLTIGDQFDALDKGLDNILVNSGGSGKDAEILKGLNEYLDGLSSDKFETETARTLAETRGDIYSTIQGRMQDINRAFDNSFYELESSYNLTKDSSKYSVIYTDGNYKDPTLGIDDYDYKVMGLLYMKEKEGTEYGSKYGYTLGFAGSKFDFDDGGSKEDVYSLRAGAHRVKNLSDEHKVSWLSRIELGYNRHIAKRKLNLQETFENKGEYNTYSIALDNRLTKVVYTDLSKQLDVYADLDLEYGKVDGFKESAGSKGGLEVQIKDNDYLSAQAGAGVKASQRIYTGNDTSVKVTADVKYAYELGDNYDGNKARLKNGGEGYYSLITPEDREGKLTGKIGLTVEKANHMGITFEVEAADESNKKDPSVKYGVRFNYKF